MKIQIQIDIDKDRLYRQSETDERVRQKENLRYDKVRQKGRQIDRQIDRQVETERERAGQKKNREIERSEIQKDQIDQVSLKGWIDRLESRGKLDRKI